jgi:hypothetical protein
MTLYLQPSLLFHRPYRFIKTWCIPLKIDGDWITLNVDKAEKMHTIGMGLLGYGTEVILYEPMNEID